VVKRDETIVGKARIGIRDGRVEVRAEGDRRIDLLRAACSAIWNSGLPIYALEVPERLYIAR
jgi:hypothetical protein